MRDNYSNRLAQSISPYLIQHANNPVDWFPWCDEAFNKATTENKPIFLSIGYSTCHWCHVMEKESFEDEQVASLMNETFVNIKVDREERPDIDSIYMTVCQLLNGNGGWPLTLFITPEKKPFFAATYIPKYSHGGRMGLIELIPKINDIWKNNKAMIDQSAEDIFLNLNEYLDINSKEEISSLVFQNAFNAFDSNFDRSHGGFGHAPKFPMPHNLSFLLRNFYYEGKKVSLQMVEKTLKSMYCGGIFDHIGGGFARYSTDERWHIPHFEKMLYDQAMLLLVYAEAFSLTKNNLWREVAEQIANYILRDMTSTDGPFYSAEDADSEGMEGKFYLWDNYETSKILGESAELFNNVFNISIYGNYHNKFEPEVVGLNIPYLIKSIDDWANELKINSNQFKMFISDSIRKLFQHRQQRIHPLKDDKVLTDWNGLMIAALSYSGKVFNEPKYTDAAKNAADFIINNLVSNNKLYHCYRNGKLTAGAMLDDFAFLIFGLTELYYATFEPKYLKLSSDLLQQQLELFSDGTGGFYFTANNSEKLIARTKDIYDGSIPSGNSVSIMNLIRLASLTGNYRYHELAAMSIDYFAGSVNAAPSAHCFMLSSLYLFNNGMKDIYIVSEFRDDETVKKMLNYVNNFFMADISILLINNENREELAEISDFTKQFKMKNGATTAYICKNFTCSEPINDFEEFKLKLQGK